MTLRKLLIAAPWITASAAASYAISQWSHLPARMAVTFYLCRVSGWQAKATAIPLMLLLMFGILTMLTVLLSMPGKIRMREGALVDAAIGGSPCEQESIAINTTPPSSARAASQHDGDGKSIPHPWV